MSDNELKPCPFCGEPAKITVVAPGALETYTVVCANAECPSHWDYEHPKDAAEAWNNQTLAARLAALEQQHAADERALEIVRYIRLMCTYANREQSAAELYQTIWNIFKRANDYLEALPEPPTDAK